MNLAGDTSTASSDVDDDPDDVARLIKGSSASSDLRGTGCALLSSGPDNVGMLCKGFI